MAGRVNTRATIGLVMLVIASLACNVQFGNSIPTTVASVASVEFIAPDNNSTIAQGATIQLAVKIVSDRIDGAQVDFLVDGNSIGQQTITVDPGTPQGDQNTATVTYSWTPKEARGYLVSVQVSRPDGSRIGAADLAIQVVAAGTAIPSILSGTPTLAGSSANTPAPLPSFTPTSDQPTLTATLIPTLAPATATLSSPAASPTLTLPPANRPTLRVTFSYLNIRAGPGVNFPQIGKMVLNDVAIIVGRNTDGTWFFIEFNGARGWVYNTPAYITVMGDTSTLPLVASPPTPTPGAAQPTVTAKLAPTSTVGAFADLVIDSVTLNPPTPSANQTFGVTIVVRNQGTVDAPSSLLKGLFQPLDEHSDTAVPAILAGQKVTVSLPVTLKASLPNQTATLTLDANQEVNEGPVGEANNVTTITYNMV